ncbi:hypothetical protein LAZ40_02235 [Cereibacter sphaeroides]|uniref:hypothetical protein n=1 Tax=Cereibacter sphaeroides TaxID=1063 RepID=UPI001F35EEEA|nr:hypothetical protein [Cereibacter sphaeroides]MCE6957876.1 hypothetical protein [Cereibacter sphaeroides]MCE6971845.1 hypothetical protein [Cereibacter sphaeroides]
MGSWNATCAISHVAITWDDPVRLILLCEVPAGVNRGWSSGALLSPSDHWVPVSLALKGQYDGYGRVTGIEPDDWSLKHVIELLRIHALPSPADCSEGETAFDPRSIADIKTVQNLIHESRLMVASPHGPLRISAMMVHEPIYQALSQRLRNDFDPEDDVLPQDMVATAMAGLRSMNDKDSVLGKKCRELVDRLSSLGTTHVDTSVFDAAARQMFVSLALGGDFSAYAADESHGLRRAGVPFSTGNTLDRLITLIHRGREGDDPVIERILTDMAGFAVFHQNMSGVRRTYAPQISSGQDEDWAMQRALADATRGLIERMTHDPDEDEPDENREIAP